MSCYPVLEKASYPTLAYDPYVDFKRSEGTLSFGLLVLLGNIICYQP